MAKKPLKPKTTKARATAKSKASQPATDEPKKAARVIKGDKDFALHYGRSTRTVQSWRDKGLPFKEVGFHQYEYDLDQTDVWVDEFTTGEENDGDSSVRKEREQIKLAIEKEQLAKAKRENAEADGNILPRDEYELHLVERNQLARDAFLNIPKQMRRHLGPKSDKPIQELQKLIEKALNQLADQGQDG